MKTKKISMLLAVLAGAGMILCGIASADSPTPTPDENSIFLVLQASGKGFEADSDDPAAPDAGIVYLEEKHKLETITLYAMSDRTQKYIFFVYPAEPAGSWGISYTDIDAETEKSLLMRRNGTLPIYYDTVNNQTIGTTGTFSVQFKTKDGAVTSAKMKSLAMTYHKDINKDPGNTQLLGALKMKGKMIDPFDMPEAVRIKFNFIP